MINITLPDGSKRRYEKPQSGLEIAQSISKSLSKEALVIKVNGTIQDLHLIIDKDSEIQIKKSTSNCYKFIWKRRESAP